MKSECSSTVMVRTLNASGQLGPGVTSLPTLVAHYWIWPHLRVALTSIALGSHGGLDANPIDGSRSCHMGWSRVYRFGNPCDRVVIHSDSSGGSGSSGSQG